MTTVRAPLHAVLVGSCLLTLVPLVASGQKRGEVVITPYAGVFTPTNELGRTAGAIIKQKIAPAVGVTASYWYNHYFGLELGSAVAFSDAEGTAVLTNALMQFAPTVAEQAYVVYGSAKAMIGLLPEDSRMSLRFGIGPAVITRSGTAYKSDVYGRIDGRTDAGAAMSLCSRIPVTENVGIRVRGEDYLYQSRLKFVSSSSEQILGRRLQSDYMLSAGLQFFVNK